MVGTGRHAATGRGRRAPRPAPGEHGRRPAHRAATSTDDAGPRTASGRRVQVVGALLGAVVGVVVCWLMQRALGDDALITVSYARTLAESGTWGVFPGITANTQTSPLNAWLLAAGMVLVDQPLLVASGFAVLCLAACGWLAVGLARRVGVAPAGGWLTVAVIATSPVLSATIGLEAYLGAAVLLGLAQAALGGRVVVTGVLCGLAVLTRPDLAVPAAVLALGLLTAPKTRWRRVGGLAAAAGLAALVALPWHVWSWFHLGGAVPDTTWVRTDDSSGLTILPAVLGWLRAFPLVTGASAVPVVLAVVAAVVAAVRPRRRWAVAVLLLVAAGWAHLGALELIGAQGAGWYYGPAVACSAAALGVAVGAAGRPVLAGVGSGVVVLAACAGVATSGALPWTSAPLVANLALTSEYAAVAAELPALTGGEPISGPGELGALAYYAAPVATLDFLSEPARTDRVMRARAAEGGLRAELMRLNGLHRRSPPPIDTPWSLDFVDPAAATGRVVRVWEVEGPLGGRSPLVLTHRG
ncbi:ArnT family glycosyltransferase [Pseudonocardia lacus]|uniref:ArnT family glycosyltransferase n=1 Tax=Pseudonocardia lacus TaxID=2835865 RepID=UPI001BDC58DA|nr:glycosyltransferase family 39 protein [Pseudonocardia lacus]